MTFFTHNFFSKLEFSNGKNFKILIINIWYYIVLQPHHVFTFHTFLCFSSMFFKNPNLMTFLWKYHANDVFISLFFNSFENLLFSLLFFVQMLFSLFFYSTHLQTSLFFLFAFIILGDSIQACIKSSSSEDFFEITRRRPSLLLISSFWRRSKSI